LNWLGDGAAAGLVAAREGKLELFRFQNPEVFGTIVKRPVFTCHNHKASMQESPHEWILKRRHEDLSLTLRASWSLYMQFYTVFLTVSVVGLGWVLTRPADTPIVPRAKHVIAIVFVIQTLLTAITSIAMALYTMRVAREQEQIENCLVQSHAAAPPACGPAVPASLARFAGWFNCAAMLAMAALWLYVGFIC